MSQGSQSKRLTAIDLFTTRDSAVSNKDARLYNVLLEQNGSELDVIKRPGFVLYDGTTTGTGNGIIPVGNADGSQSILPIVNNNANLIQTITTGVKTTVGTVAISGHTQPVCVLYFQNKFWILNFSDGTKGVWSSPDTVTWTQVTATPAFNVSAFRSWFYSCVFGGYMWVVAGFENSSLFNDVWYSSDGAKWSQATNNAAFSARMTPTATNGVSVPSNNLLVFNNKMWMIGGQAPASNYLNDVWSSPDGVTWTRATASAAWSIREAFGSFVLAGAMWLVGGRQISGNTVLNDIYSSTDGATWTSHGNAGWAARFLPGCCVFNNYAYLIMGATTADGSVEASDLWRTLDGITWTQVSSNVGLTGKAAPLISTGNAMYVMGFLHAPASIVSTTYSFSDTTTTTVSATGGTVTSGQTTGTTSGVVDSPFIDFCQNTAGTQIAMKSTLGAWVLTPLTSTVTKVTDANYPAVTVRGVVYLDGTFYVMDQAGKIYGSNLNDFSTWSAINFLTAQTEPDPGVCIAKLNQYVVAFGQYTTEFFFDAGNAVGSPLSPVISAQKLIGCANGDTVVGASSALYFVSQEKSHGQAVTQGFKVSRIQGLQAEPISTNNEERILNADGLSGAWGISMTLYGHTFYVINLPTSALSLAFDIDSSRWYVFTVRTLGTAQSVGAGKLTYTTQVDGTALVNLQLTGHGFSDGDPIIIAGANQAAYNGTWNVTYIDANNVQYVAASVPATTPATGTITAQGSSESNLPFLMPCQFQGLQIFQSISDGKLYKIVDTTFTDNGVFIDSRIRTSRQDGGVNQPKFCAWVDVITDRASANALVRYTDDDYQTYTKFRKVSLSGKRSRLTRQGSFLRRAFELRHTDTSAWRFQALDLGLEQGGE